MSAPPCPHCQQVHPPEAQFCPLTGQPLYHILTCPRCQEKIQADWRVCGYCGMPFRANLPPAWPTSAPDEQAPAGDISPPSFPYSGPPHREYADRKTSSRLPVFSALKGVWGIALLIAVVLILLCVGAFYLGNYLLDGGKTPSVSRAKPPHFGVYLVSGSSLVEMKNRVGRPDKGETEGIPTAKDAQPKMIIWLSEYNLQSMHLAGNYGNGNQFEHKFTATPLEDGMIEIQPDKALKSDVYCLMQGGPMVIRFQEQTWCLRIP